MTYRQRATLTLGCASFAAVVCALDVETFVEFGVAPVNPITAIFAIFGCILLSLVCIIALHQMEPS